MTFTLLFGARSAQIKVTTSSRRFAASYGQKLGQICATRFTRGPNSAQTANLRNNGQFRARMANFAQQRPNFAQEWPNSRNNGQFAQLWPNSRNVGQIRAITANLRNYGQFRATMAKFAQRAKRGATPWPNLRTRFTRLVKIHIHR